MFSVDCDAIDANDILDIHRHLMKEKKKRNIKQCSELLEKCLLDYKLA